MSWLKEVRVVVGLDFGTTYSGFTLYHVDDDDIGDIKTNSEWPGELGKFKTNTVLQYKEDFEEVELWGYPALYKKPNRRSGEKFKPKLPEPLTYKQAITDYLFKIGELIKETIPKYWTGIDFMEHILLVLTVPAGYSENDKAIMRESEAAAIYCMYSSLKEHKLTEPGTTFMIVDCGGGTVDLTTRKLLEENQLGEVTRRAGDFCGSTFIDNEFIELLKFQEFCQNVKLPFTGNNPDFSYEIDLEEIAPALLQYVTGLEKIFMEEKEWMIQLDFNTIKSMFDPIIDRIIGMIRVQLDNSSEKCSAIFLVGGFSQSKYLQKRIEKEFGRLVENISVPNQPIAAVVRGAAIYGKSLQESKNLKSNEQYGDPLDRLTSDGRIDKFLKIVECDDIVTIDQEFTTEDLVPICPDQTTITFDIYYTREQDADYCNEPDEIRVIVGLDFGTTYSGFSLYHVDGEIGDVKTNIGELIKETIPKYWEGIDFMEHILLVLTVPAEYSENDKAIMRECTFNAGLIGEKNSEKLQFTTEPEAAAIYCMYSSLKEHKLTEPGTTFMIVDCGGGTVD
ncbi:unnamed protein product [Rhizophagus irregularis]|nr:unnamed protein product [Rhizophagus irregularis]